MKTWDAFFPDVLPMLVGTGVPDPTIVHQLRRAAQTFCTKTRAWKVVLDSTLTTDGTTVYDLELERNVELVRLESATLNGQPYAVWRAGDDACGRFVSTQDGKTIEISQGVGPNLPLVLTCSVKPGNAATGIDDAIFDSYAEVIALGAVARLTDNPAKRIDFENQIDVIKTRLWRGNAAIRPRARPSFF